MDTLHVLRRAVWRAAVAAARLLPAALVERVLVRVAHAKAHSLPPEDGLRLLLRIDSALYPMEGELAVKYGAGTHTKHAHMRYHDFFTERIGPGERVLDVGCGIGAVAYSIASKTGAKVVGIDIEPKRIEQAERENSHANLTYVVGDATVGVPEGSYDVVVLSNVLEHREERAGFLRALLASARPARVLIRVPLFERDWRVPLKRELGVEWRLDDDHEIEYTPATFEQETSEAGLEIVEQQLRWGEIWAELRPVAA
jgi:SAM-dependent methyltransferase